MFPMLAALTAFAPLAGAGLLLRQAASLPSVVSRQRMSQSALDTLVGGPIVPAASHRTIGRNLALAS